MMMRHKTQGRRAAIQMRKKGRSHYVPPPFQTEKHFFHLCPDLSKRNIFRLIDFGDKHNCACCFYCHQMHVSINRNSGWVFLNFN